jgi:hypothetical protein
MFCVPDTTVLYISGWMQMVYCHMIYSPETKYVSKQDGEVLNLMWWNIITVYIQNGNYSQWLHTLCTMGPPCYAGLSSNLLGCSMRVLPPPLLLINCLSCSLPGGPGPPPFPPPGLTPFPSGSRHLPASSSATFWYPYWTIQEKKVYTIRRHLLYFSVHKTYTVNPAKRIRVWKLYPANRAQGQSTCVHWKSIYGV